MTAPTGEYPGAPPVAPKTHVFDPAGQLDPAPIEAADDQEVTG